MRRRRVHSFLLEVHAEAGRLLERDENGRAPLPKLRVTKQHFPRPDRHRDVAEWRLADPLIVDPDLGPGRGVDIEQSGRGIEAEPRGSTGDHVEALRRAVAERVIDEFEVMIAGRQHCRFGLGDADRLPVQVDLQRDRRRYREPSRRKRRRYGINRNGRPLREGARPARLARLLLELGARPLLVKGLGSCLVRCRRTWLPQRVTAVAELQRSLPPRLM